MGPTVEFARLIELRPQARILIKLRFLFFYQRGFRVCERAFRLIVLDSIV
jgi:hypothetical protein